MMGQEVDRIVDGDGHVMEDLAAIIHHMPEAYWGGFHQGIKNPFPPLDHLHSANQLGLPTDAFAPVGMEGWLDFMIDVGISKTVLYTTMGLSFGKIVSRDWAIELARAYNDWIAETYIQANPRFQAMALIPLQDPAEAVLELRRSVEELGLCGGMLPTTGADQAMSHLGDERYWPIYERHRHPWWCARRLGHGRPHPLRTGARAWPSLRHHGQLRRHRLQRRARSLPPRTIRFRRGGRRVVAHCHGALHRLLG